MNKVLATLFLFTVLLLSHSVDVSAQVTLSTFRDSLGYHTGQQFGRTLLAGGMPINKVIMIAGVKDALLFNPSRLTESQIDMVNMGVAERAQALVEKGDTLDGVEVKLYGKITSNGPDKIKTVNDSISYALGFKYGKGVFIRKLNIDAMSLISGLDDALHNRASILSMDAELELNMYQAQQKLLAPSKGDLQIERDLEFMQETSKKPNVTTMASGMMYEVLKPGSGEKAKLGDVVELNIRSWYIGQEQPFFDSEDSDSPIILPVSEAMPDWVEILQKMDVGSTWRLYIPAEIVYANSPDAPLKRPVIYEIVLISIESADSDD